MNTLQHFGQVGRRGFYRPTAVVTFDRALAMCVEAMRQARSLELADLLLNTCGLTGFVSPDVFKRYEIANKWAESAGTTLRVAMVCRPDVMDPEKIAVLMAQNRGASGDVFLTEVAALAWLDGQSGGTTGTFTGKQPVLKPPE